MTAVRGPDSFAGEWQVQRQIEDFAAHQLVSFAGRAVLTPSQGGLDYIEDGTLVLPGQADVRATRRYHWQFSGDRVDVFFEDGRFFHAFDPSGSTAKDRHWCDPDTYDARYCFANWPLWTTVWTVRGPRKDYRSTTEYHRPRRA